MIPKSKTKPNVDFAYTDDDLDLEGNHPSKSRTLQSDRNRADIKKILSGAVPMPSPGDFVFGDFSDGATFQTQRDRVLVVQQKFDSLPAETRYRFGNDPAKMLDMLADVETNPELREEAVKLGLIEPLPEKPGKVLPDPDKKPSAPKDVLAKDSPKSKPAVDETA